MSTELNGTVLITGGFGLVGSATVRRLVELGHRVVATDLDTLANRKAAQKLPRDVEFRWADLTDSEQVQRLVSEIAPDAIIHLAAIIAPAIYPIPKVARRVNVDATANLVRVAEEQQKPPRFVHASSITVMGPRNPHGTTPPLKAEDSMRPYDVYSGQKSEGEEIVRGSTLDWAVLRLGAVVGPDLRALPVSADMAYLQSVVPSDGRVQTVDVRDVAWALAAATTADVAREILLIGGDDSHRLTYAEVTSDLVAALGLPGAMPPGRPGDPNSGRRLVRHRLDGHHPRPRGVAFPEPLVARTAGRTIEEVPIVALPGPTHRPACASGHGAPVAVSERTRSVRRPVGEIPCQIGRAVMGSAQRGSDDVGFAPSPLQSPGRTRIALVRKDFHASASCCRTVQSPCH